jgi:hypothetical protein
MTRPVKTGRVVETGFVTAQDIAGALGLGMKREELRPPDSPRQSRLRSEGRDREADALTPEGFTVEKLSAADIHDALGRPSLSPPPNSPDGTPCPPEPRHDYEPERRSESVAMNAPSPEESAAEIRRDAAEQAAQLAGTSTAVGYPGGKIGCRRGH